MTNKKIVPQCSIEGCHLPQANRKYQLCNHHNYIRLHGKPKVNKAIRSDIGNAKAKSPALRFKPVCRTKAIKHQFKRKKTGEAELFRQIWEERGHCCTNCKAFLGSQPRTFFFAHIKPKGNYPELRLDPTNIRLLCLECHRAYDQGTKEQFNKRSR